MPYTEELISRLFLVENSIWRLFWDRVDPWPAAGWFFPALCHFCIRFHRFAKSQGVGKVFSGGFVSKTLRWISFQRHWLHFQKPILTSLIVVWIGFQQCSSFYANMTVLPLSSLLYFHHHQKEDQLKARPVWYLPYSKWYDVPSFIPPHFCHPPAWWLCASWCS